MRVDVEMLTLAIVLGKKSYHDKKIYFNIQ